MYVIVFFLLLWVLFQATLCEVKCLTDTLYLLETENDSHIKKNTIFKNILRTSRNYVKVPLIKKLKISSSTSLLKTIEDTKNKRYVINLHVEDFYKNNYNDILNKGFVWAGDIGEGEKEPVCLFDNKVLKDGRETCIDANETQKHVKLVSKEVMLMEYLYNFTINFHPLVTPIPTPTPVNHIILVCTNSLITNLPMYNKILKFDNGIKNIEYRSSTNCNYDIGTKYREEDVIAIIAESPNSIPETNKPVIFYEEPYAFPEDTAFYKNSIWRMRSAEPLADAFMKFIRKMNWRRVAVLSDDAIESDEFEKELRKLLEYEGVAYTVTKVRETDGHYNFSKALTFLNQGEARIIIANVAEPHVRTLSRQANQHGMTISRGVQWIARDWSIATASEATQSLYSVFSVSPSRTSITTHIEGINRVIDQNICDKHYDYLNQRKFAEDIRKNHKWNEKTQVVITETKYRYQIRPLQSTIGTYTDGVGTYHSVPTHIADRKAKCNVKSVNYNKPCDDFTVIFIMLVIMVTSVTILGITYFFQIPDTNYNRMP